LLYIDIYQSYYIMGMFLFFIFKCFTFYTWKTEQIIPVKQPTLQVMIICANSKRNMSLAKTLTFAENASVFLVTAALNDVGWPSQVALEASRLMNPEWCDQSSCFPRPKRFLQGSLELSPCCLSITSQ